MSELEPIQCGFRFRTLDVHGSSLTQQQLWWQGVVRTKNTDYCFVLDWCHIFVITIYLIALSWHSMSYTEHSIIWDEMSNNSSVTALSQIPLIIFISSLLFPHTCTWNRKIVQRSNQDTAARLSSSLNLFMLEKFNMKSFVFCCPTLQ